jgi:hypothetical protein
MVKGVVSKLPNCIDLCPRIPYVHGQVQRPDSHRNLYVVIKCSYIMSDAVSF